MVPQWLHNHLNLTSHGVMLSFVIIVDLDIEINFNRFQKNSINFLVEPMRVIVSFEGDVSLLYHSDTIPVESFFPGKANEDLPVFTSQVEGQATQY